MAEWLRRGLQILARRFDSGSGLHFAMRAACHRACLLTSFLGSGKENVGHASIARVAPILDRSLKWHRALGLACLAVAGPCAGQETSERGVIVRQVINRNYESDLQSVETQLASNRLRERIVRSGETLSTIIAKEFGIGSRSSPNAYDRFEREIVTLNGLRSPDRVYANERLAIPEAIRNFSLPASRPPRSRQPLFAIDGRIAADRASTLGELARAETDGKSPNPSPSMEQSEVVQYVLVSEEEARQISDVDPSATVAAIPIDITFAQNSQATDPAWLPATTKSFLRTKLAQTALQRPVLIILDDAWPDDAAFRNSRDFFASSLKSIRASFKLPTKPLSGTLASSQTISWIGSPPPKRHAEGIAAALAPLQDLAPADGRVETYFLPLFARDKGAAEILHQLIEINHLILNLRPPYYGEIPSSLRTAAKELAETVIRSVQAESDTSKAMRSDVAVVQSALSFCAYFNQATQRPCFVSLSWTTPNDWFKVNFPSDFQGLFVAAAGNQGSATNIYVAQHQFAARSTWDGHFLAVMNIDESGQPACDSSVFGSDLTGVFGVAFSGAQGPNDCGTSYSAPRVAWLIAAREAIRARPDPAYMWNPRIQQEFKGLRNGVTGYERIRFVPEDVLSR
jgi:hypothetical protein